MTNVRLRFSKFKVASSVQRLSVYCDVIVRNSCMFSHFTPTFLHSSNLILFFINSLNFHLLHHCFIFVCVQVRLSSKQTPHFLSDSSRPLSHAHCLELANHYLGFNGWTSDIITVRNTHHQFTPLHSGEFVWEQVTSCVWPPQLKELTNEEEEEEDDKGGGRWRRLRFGCLLQLSFPHHRQTTRAAAVVEDSFTCTGEDGST